MGHSEKKLEAGLGANRAQLALPGRGKGGVTWGHGSGRSSLVGQRNHLLSLRHLCKLPIQRFYWSHGKHIGFWESREIAVLSKAK